MTGDVGTRGAVASVGKPAMLAKLGTADIEEGRTVEDATGVGDAAWEYATGYWGWYELIS